MHAMGGAIDVRKFGGLRRILPVTHLTYLAGSAALAGVPLLSGFWSKDAILDTLKGAAEHGHNAGTYWIIFGLALTTAALTAFYTFRAYFLTFHGELRIPPEAGDHAHESPSVMTVPLIVLALGAVFAGLAVEPLTHAFSGFLAKTPSLQQANALTEFTDVHSHFDWTVAILGSVVALAGIAVAWRVYGKGGPVPVPAALRGLHAFSRDKLYVDEIYAALVVKPAEAMATAGRQLDWAAAGVARLVAYLPRFAGALLRPLQNGLVQFYALGMVLGLAVFLAVIVFRSSR
jgi:NADH-quinone oxidoreductase subunit L